MTSRGHRAVVLDSWAVLAYLGDEGSGQAVADVIAQAHETGRPLSLSMVNAGEVWYILARKTSESVADRAIAELRRLGIEFVEVSWQLARTAARFKARGKISFADCFAAALALESKAELVTGDPEFRLLEGEVAIRWV